MNKELLNEALLFAVEHGLTSIEVEGVKFTVPTLGKRADLAAVPDMKPEEIVKPMDPLADISEEEIMYWATPHYDHLQAMKKQREEQLKLEEKTRG